MSQLARRITAESGEDYKEESEVELQTDIGTKKSDRPRRKWKRAARNTGVIIEEITDGVSETGHKEEQEKNGNSDQEEALVARPKPPQQP